MDALRHFQHAQAFRLLAQDLAGTLTRRAPCRPPLGARRHRPRGHARRGLAHLSGAGAPPPRFAIVGYGKLGGKELGYASDLDLVFLFDADDDDDAAPERYARLARRLMTWLTSTTAAGQLYDTDLRLRPDGAAGLMVSSVAAFRKYQRDPGVALGAPGADPRALRHRRPGGRRRFRGRARRDPAAAPDPVALAADVVEMRRKMAAGHPNPTDRLRPQARPGRNGRRRVHGPVPRAGTRGRASCAHAQPRQHRAASHRRRARPRSGTAWRPPPPMPTAISAAFSTRYGSPTRRTRGSIPRRKRRGGTPSRRCGRPCSAHPGRAAPERNRRRARPRRGGAPISAKIDV